MLTAVFRNAVVVLIVVSFTACTTMRPLEDLHPAKIQEEIEIGDLVEILATNGTTYELEVTKLDDKALYGDADSGKRYKVPFGAIKTIQVEKVSGWKTTGVTLIAIYVVVSVAVGYALMQLFEGC
jgi:hypothetical protein